MKRILIHVAVFFAALLILLAALLAVNAIPRDALRGHLQSSADYYIQYDLRRDWVDGWQQSKEDLFADAAILNIIACMEPGLAPTLDAKYSATENTMNASFYAAAYEDLEGTVSYARYWHGAVIPATLMLLVTDIHGIRVAQFVLLALLIGLFGFLCYRKRQMPVFVTYLIAFVVTMSFFVPLSMEYMACYVLSLLAAMAVLCGDESRLTYLFLLTGLFTAFFDFLTCETMTYLLPILVLIARKRQEKTLGEPKQTLLAMFGYAVLWGIGYVGTFLAKWSLTAVAVGGDVWTSVLESGGEKFAKELPADLVFGLRGSAIFNNFSSLLPSPLYDTVGHVFLWMGGTFLVLFCVWFLFRREGSADLKWVIPLWVTTLLPYLRYFVLGYHSILHFFFTYRAQLPVCMAVLLFFAWTVFVPKPKKEKKIR